MRKKITVVGAGNVGATCAQELARRDYADVAPIGGVVLGSGGQKIDVAVDVVPAD